MELRQLKIFVAVAQELNFTRAAESLGYAQSNVTAQVRLLEEELETKLFERLGKKVALTPDGEQFLRYSNQILKYATEAKNVLSGSAVPHGTITVGVPESLCVFRLPKLFKTYFERYPQVKLVIRLGTPAEFNRWLRDNTIDIAFFLAQANQDSNPELVTTTLLPEPMVIVGEPEHRLAKVGQLIPEDIRQECLILTECGCTYRTALEQILAARNVQPGATLEFGSIEAIKQFAASGLGIALLPRAAVEAALQDKRLADLNWAGPPFDMYTQIVYHKDKWISPTIASFLDMVYSYFQDLEADK